MKKYDRVFHATEDLGEGVIVAITANADRPYQVAWDSETEGYYREDELVLA